MTHAGLMQEAKDIGTHLFSLVVVHVGRLAQHVVVDPMRMQSQCQQQRHMQQKDRSMETV